MDIIQSAITDKINNSIKEKLKDMKLFVDDELPNYIMILVANKRSKHHMEKDLSLFLGNESTEFTNWLWDLVNSLKLGSKVIQVASSEQELDSNSSADAPEFKENRAEEDDVLNYDPTEEEEFLRTEITGAFLNSSEALIPDSVAVKEIPDSVQVEATKMPDDIIEAAVRKSAQKSAKVYPVQRVKEVPTSTSETRKLNYAENVSSVVRVTQRKNSKAYILQNKLLLKAVNDAAKSASVGKDINDYFKPTPVKVFPSNVTRTFKAKKENCNAKRSQGINFEAVKNLRTVKSLNQLKMNIKADNCNTSSPMDEGPTSLPDSKHQITPHFIVTSDGGNSSSLKRKRSSVELMEVDENISSHESLDVVSTKKQKLKEKCSRKVPAKTPAFTKPVVKRELICKYYPKCTDKSCRFIHLKQCRFGLYCRNPKCLLSHFKVPHRSLLKWKAH